MARKEKVTPRRKPSPSPSPPAKEMTEGPKEKSEEAVLNSSHKDKTLQHWKPEVMKAAYYEYEAQKAPGYRGPKYGYKVIARKYDLPLETFRKRTTGPLRGIFIHLSGGKGEPHIFMKEQFTHFVSHSLLHEPPRSQPCPTVLLALLARFFRQRYLK